MSVTIYQRRSVTGTTSRQLSGLIFEAAGPNTFRVLVAQLAGLTPAPGDRLRTTEKKWFTVTAVAELATGAYPLTCEPEGGAT